MFFKTFFQRPVVTFLMKIYLENRRLRQAKMLALKSILLRVRRLWLRRTELGSPTTANFCFFRWKMTNILSDSNWNQCTYFFHLFPSLDLTVRAITHQKTWHFKKNSPKNQKKIAIQERWKQLLMKCKGIMYKCCDFYLDSTFKLIYNKEIFI